EYFQRPRQVELSARWGVSDLGTYLRLLVERRTTPNGVFGLKIFHSHLSPEVGAWMQRLPDPHFVHLVREDPIRQAVSLARAYRTGEWVKQPEDAHPGDY